MVSTGVDALILVLAAALIAALGLELVEQLIRRPAIAAALTLGVSLADALFDLPRIPWDGPNVYPDDVAVAALLTAAIARALRARQLRAPSILMLLLVSLSLLSLVRGMTVYGLESPVSEARGTLAYLAAAGYFATVRPSDELVSRVARWWLAAAGLLAALSVLRWAALASGLQTIALLEPGTSGVRVLDARESLVVGQGALIALVTAAGAERARRMPLIAALLLGVTLLLEHRSVWVVVLVSALALFMRNRILSGKLAVTAFGALAVGLVLILTVFTGTEGSVEASLADSATNTGTFEWRVRGWAALLDEVDEYSPVQYAIGGRWGSGWERRIEGFRVIDYSPHNFYIQIFLRTGVIGLLVLISLLWRVLRSLPRRLTSFSVELTPELLRILLVGHVAYFMVYAPDFEQGIITGIAAGMCRVAARSGRYGEPSHPEWIPQRSPSVMVSHRPVAGLSDR